MTPALAQVQVLSLEICIVVDVRITVGSFVDGKADAVNEAEGSSPEYVKASADAKRTTGVGERGMY